MATDGEEKSIVQVSNLCLLSNQQVLILDSSSKKASRKVLRKAKSWMSTAMRYAHLPIYLKHEANVLKSSIAPKENDLPEAELGLALINEDNGTPKGVTRSLPQHNH